MRRGRGPTPATLPTRAGPLPTSRPPMAPIWAGRLLSTLISTEAARAEVDPPRAGTEVEQATAAAVGTGAAGAGTPPAPVTVAVDKRDPSTAPRCSTDPDRLSTILTRSGKEDVGRAVEPPATAGAGATVNPESPRSREATAASARSR